MNLFKSLLAYSTVAFFASMNASCATTPVADVPYNSPGAMNPFIPGYFADPTVKKFGDTYYVYATTDGSGAGFGPAQVWTSKDFVNWTLMPMNWPDSHWIWAPDVMLNAADSLYYYVYCQPCQIHVGSSSTPRGPWQNILGESEAVLIPDRFVTGAITLDGQTFVDDDGSIYMYWGTWGIYDGFGCGAGQLAPDMKTFLQTRLTPNTEATKFFEAPFVLKRNGVYYFMYSSDSCHDHTYHVQYATSDNPLGPYTYRGPILTTNEDGTVHGPGHHSVLEQDGEYYIVYHRHDNPHSNRGFHRQVCIDRMEFLPDGSIKPITPTHRGVGALAPSMVKGRNLAFGASVKASSWYDENFKPEYAVDDNNGTLWRPAGYGSEWIEIDLGKLNDIRTIWTQWEYGTQFYQYLIETSIDGKRWETYADKRTNRLAGSPMVDFGNKKARYVRITSTGGQKVGFPGALWNVKIFDTVEDSCPQQWLGLTGADWDGIQWVNNEGQLGGAFKVTKGNVTRVYDSGKTALRLTPGTTISYENPLLKSDGAHTLSALTKRPGDSAWQADELAGCLSGGNLTISALDEPLLITDLRYYNYDLTPAEKEFNTKTDIVRLPIADNTPLGKLVEIDADRFNVGDTVAYIPNNGVLGGYFEAQGAPVVVEEINGVKGFKFDGSQWFTSSFPLPATIRDNCPYTLTAKVLNPEIAENECYIDFTSSHDELEKIMGVLGSEPRCGLMQHYGWYEDAGWNDYTKLRGDTSATFEKPADLEGKWTSIHVYFDGRIESVRINGVPVSSKDIQLLVQPVQTVTLGRNAEGEWPFTGYVNKITLYDSPVQFVEQKY